MSLKSFTIPETQIPIHPAAQLGPVDLTVMNLERQVRFHQDVLGMQLHWRQDNRAGMGAGKDDLLRLVEQKDAVVSRRTTGLYHTAILLPAKRDLAQLLMRIYQKRSPLQGMSDHGTHLAIYLPDAEGNGIELAWDRPKESWPNLATILREGTPDAMRRLTAPLDVDDLLSELKLNPGDWSAMPVETQIGHVHLHVSDLAASRYFYHDLLGFDVTLESERFGMIFFSAGGYHHHIGANIWNGAGAPPPPANAAGLRWFTVRLPDSAHLGALVDRVRRSGWQIEPASDGYLLRDPASNGIRLVAAR